MQVPSIITPFPISWQIFLEVTSALVVGGCSHIRTYMNAHPIHVHSYPEWAQMAATLFLCKWWSAALSSCTRGSLKL